MSSDFDSFDQSPLGAFIQSPLGARGLQSESIQTGTVFVGSTASRSTSIPFNGLRFTVGGSSPNYTIDPIDQAFPDDTPVRLTIDGVGVLPAPLAESTTYYVVNSDDTSLDLSATEGGSAIELTSTGTAPMIIGSDFAIASNLSVLTNDSAKYDPVTGAWSAADGGGNFNATISQLIAIGGIVYAREGGNVRYYDRWSNDWILMSPGFTVRDIIDYNGTLLAVGVSVGVGKIKTFNATTNTWSAFVSVPPISPDTDNYDFYDAAYDSVNDVLWICGERPPTTAVIFKYKSGNWSRTTYGASIDRFTKIGFLGSTAYVIHRRESASRRWLRKWDGIDASGALPVMTDDAANPGGLVLNNQFAFDIFNLNNRLFVCGSFDEWRVRESGVTTDHVVGNIVEITGDLTFNGINGGLANSVTTMSESNGKLILLSSQTMKAAGGTKPGASGLAQLNGSALGLFQSSCGADRVTAFVDSGLTETTSLNSSIAITVPADGSAHHDDDTITFTGTATDDLDGDISASIAWSSDIDGSISTGASVSTSALSVNDHTITASITNSRTLTSTDTIDISVEVLTITSVSPTSGSESGGTSITITGKQFTASTTITFDGNSATSVVFVNSTTITCVTPAGTGTVDIVVTDGAESDTLTNGFTYSSDEPPPPPPPI